MYVLSRFSFSLHSRITGTAHKMKFSIKDFLVYVTKSVVSCEGSWGRERPILTHLYHFHRLHIHLDNSRATLVSAYSDQTEYGKLWLSSASHYPRRHVVFIFLYSDWIRRKPEGHLYISVFSSYASVYCIEQIKFYFLDYCLQCVLQGTCQQLLLLRHIFRRNHQQYHEK